MTPDALKYAKTHEWVRVEENRATIGITDFAQEELGDIVYLELPEQGVEVAAGDEVGVVESVKAVSELYCPVTGTVVETNTSLIDAPEVVNQDPYGEGWLWVVEMSDPTEVDALLTAEQYEAFLREEGH